jgi:hypothetical protein
MPNFLNIEQLRRLSEKVGLCLREKLELWPLYVLDSCIRKGLDSFKVSFKRNRAVVHRTLMRHNFMKGNPEFVTDNVLLLYELYHHTNDSGVQSFFIKQLQDHSPQVRDIV